MSDFSFESDSIALPKGVWAKTHRHRLRSRTVLALTQGYFCSYVYPLCTPAGFCVNSDSGYLDSISDEEQSGLHGIIFAAACEFSKRARNVPTNSR